jgi:hypothetical protein
MLFTTSGRERIHEAQFRETGPAGPTRSECSSQPDISGDSLRVGEVALEPACELLQLGWIEVRDRPESHPAAEPV